MLVLFINPNESRLALSVTPFLFMISPTLFESAVLMQKYIVPPKNNNETILDILIKVGFMLSAGEFECKSTQTPIKKKIAKIAVVM
jgi:hypothetical protein